MNKEFERCCTFLAEMMEKYEVQVMRDIAIEPQINPETWEFDAEGKRLPELNIGLLYDWYSDASGILFLVSNLYSEYYL